MLSEDTITKLFKHNLKEDTGEFLDFLHDNETIYQYAVGSHNFLMLTEDQWEQVDELAKDRNIEEEGKLITKDKENGNYTFIEDDPEEATQTFLKVLNDVYGLELSDIDDVVEHQGKEEISWTELDL